VRGPTRREALLGGLVVALAAAGLLLPEGRRIRKVEAFRVLLGEHAPPADPGTWEEMADAFFGYDGEAIRICRELAMGARTPPPADPLACLTRPEPGIEALDALRRRAIEFVAFGTDLLNLDRPPAEPVRFIGVPDPMSGRFCNPVARFDEGAERGEG
jgi:hypothetical protein